MIPDRPALGADQAIVEGVLAVLATLRAWRRDPAAAPAVDPAPCELYSPHYEQACGEWDRRRRLERDAPEPIPGQLVLPPTERERSA